MKKCKCGEPVEADRYDFCYDCWWAQDPRNKNQNQYRCGNCGETKHELFSNKDKIIVSCIGCENKSAISVTQPRLSIDWVGRNKGILAIF
jgi:hypothetical protein